MNPYLIFLIVGLVITTPPLVKLLFYYLRPNPLREHPGRVMNPLPLYVPSIPKNLPRKPVTFWIDLEEIEYPLPIDEVLDPSIEVTDSIEEVITEEKSLKGRRSNFQLLSRRNNPVSHGVSKRVQEGFTGIQPTLGPVEGPSGQMTPYISENPFTLQDLLKKKINIGGIITAMSGRSLTTLCKDSRGVKQYRMHFFRSRKWHKEFLSSFSVPNLVQIKAASLRVIKPGEELDTQSIEGLQFVLDRSITPHLLRVYYPKDPFSLRVPKDYCHTVQLNPHSRLQVARARDNLSILRQGGIILRSEVEEFKILRPLVFIGEDPFRLNPSAPGISRLASLMLTHTWPIILMPKSGFPHRIIISCLGQGDLEETYLKRIFDLPQLKSRNKVHKQGSEEESPSNEQGSEEEGPSKKKKARVVFENWFYNIIPTDKMTNVLLFHFGACMSTRMNEFYNRQRFKPTILQYDSLEHDLGEESSLDQLRIPFIGFLRKVQCSTEDS